LGYGAKAAAEGIPNEASQAAPAQKEKSQTSEKPTPASAPVDNAPAAATPATAASTNEATSKLDALSIGATDPPAVPTKPGPPEGVVVFDHEPTKDEAEQAAQLNGAAIKPTI
jgi:poly(3-hydroxybutyrate) depolymerase